jgi:hypothetical protein
VGKMIDVRLPGYFIQMEKFLRLFQRLAPRGEDCNQFSLGCEAQLGIPDMTLHHVEFRFRD